MIDWKNPPINYAIANEVMKHSFAIHNKGNQLDLIITKEMTDYTLKCLQYIAFHRDKIDKLGEMSISEGLNAIEHRIAKATSDNIEDVKKWCVFFQELKDLIEPSSSMWMTISGYLEKDFPNPDTDYNEFIRSMFDYYQAIFLLLTQMKEEESITLLLALFTDADHKEYVTILNIINDVLSGKHLL
jgi:hypothetical protein